MHATGSGFGPVLLIGVCVLLLHMLLFSLLTSVLITHLRRINGVAMLTSAQKAWQTTLRLIDRSSAIMTGHRTNAAARRGNSWLWLQLWPWPPVAARGRSWPWPPVAARGRGRPWPPVAARGRSWPWPPVAVAARGRSWPWPPVAARGRPWPWPPVDARGRPWPWPDILILGETVKKIVFSGWIKYH